jgi:hypothetical protein
MLYLPKTIKNGKRNATLLSLCNNYVLLNDFLAFGEVFAYIMEQNLEKCSEPLTEAEIKGIVNSVFRYKRDGTLKPQGQRLKKFFYGKHCGMNLQEKIEDVNKCLGEWKREKTASRIYQAIEEWDSLERITKKAVCNVTGFSLATIKRYWQQFKEYAEAKETEILEQRGSNGTNIYTIYKKEHIAPNEPLPYSLTKIKKVSDQNQNKTHQNDKLD